MAPVITFLVIFFFLAGCGFSAGSGETAIIGIGAGILFGYAGLYLVADALDSTSTPKKRRKLNEKRKKQEDYDNYWGIIDWHDR